MSKRERTFLNDSVTLMGIVSDLRLLQFGGINASTLYTDDTNAC